MAACAGRYVGSHHQSTLERRQQAKPGSSLILVPRSQSGRWERSSAGAILAVREQIGGLDQDQLHPRRRRLRTPAHGRHVIGEHPEYLPILRPGRGPDGRASHLRRPPLTMTRSLLCGGTPWRLFHNRAAAANMPCICFSILRRLHSERHSSGLGGRLRHAIRAQKDSSSFGVRPCHGAVVRPGRSWRCASRLC
jgi:hypothetical protein